MAPIVYPPPVWRHQDVELYHGTVAAHAPAICGGDISIARGRTHTDFGQGFYTTTLFRQARTWAAELAASIGGTAAVVKLILDRDDLGRLETLGFVRGDFDAEDYWSFVHHCRAGHPDHARPATGWYDVVYGPVAAFWNQRMAILGADQVSFHTAAAETVLNAAGLAGRITVV